MFLGYYNLANFITLAGLASSIVSIIAAAAYDFKTAVIMLAVSGVCDMFDGKIARNNIEKYDEKAKIFGSALDSLCDFVSFTLTPAMIAYFFGNRTAVDLFIYIIFVICGAIRLAYYTAGAAMHPGKQMSFRGVPVTVTSVFLPIIFAIAMFADPFVTGYLIRILLVTLSIAFIINIKVPRPGMKLTLGMVAACLLCLALMVLLQGFPVKYIMY